VPWKLASGTRKYRPDLVDTTTDNSSVTGDRDAADSHANAAVAIMACLHTQADFVKHFFLPGLIGPHTPPCTKSICTRDAWLEPDWELRAAVSIAGHAGTYPDHFQTSQRERERGGERERQLVIANREPILIWLLQAEVGQRGATWRIGVWGSSAEAEQSCSVIEARIRERGEGDVRGWPG